MGWDGKTPRARSHPPRKCYDNNTTQTHPKGMQLRHGAGSVGADRVRQREGELGAAVHHDEEMRLALHFDDGTWNVLGSGEGFLALCCCCCCGRQRQNLQGGFPRTRAAPAPPAPRPRAGRRCPPPPVCRRPNIPDRGVKSRVTRTCEQPPQGAPKHPSTHPSTYLVRRRLPRVATGPDGAERLDAHPVQLQEPRHLCVVRV